MVKTLGLTHLALTVSDLNRSFQFYHDVFGMLAVYREPHFIQAQTPGARDVLVLEEGDVDVGNSGGIKHFGFRLTDARDIDKALKLGLNHPMGPFEMIDLVGLDTRLNILTFLYQTLGEKYRPCPLLVKYVKAGRLGKKAGKGVYEY